MSSTELHTGKGRTEHPPIWAIALAGTLLAASFGRRRAEQEGAAPNKEAQRFDQDTARRGERAADSGRGRAADTPSEIPAKGWKDILLRVYHGISEDRILLVAAGVTFYLLLSIFPGIAALFSIYGLFANPAEIAGHVDALASVAPGGAMDILREEMNFFGWFNARSIS
jgi:membrane protein